MNREFVLVAIATEKWPKVLADGRDELMVHFEYHNIVASSNLREFRRINLLNPFNLVINNKIRNWKCNI